MFGMNLAKPIWNELGKTHKFDKDERGKGIDETKYRGIINSLIYLTSFRLDLSFNIGLYSRFQLYPKESHLTIFAWNTNT